MTGKRSKRAAGALPRQPWRVHFFRRHPADDPAQAVPARAFLDTSHIKVSATMIAVVRAVADAPPPAFSGGGKWEATFDSAFLGGYEETSACIYAAVFSHRRA